MVGKPLTDAQRIDIEKLFKKGDTQNPDNGVVKPKPAATQSTAKRQSRGGPTNFHVYKEARRKELDRLETLQQEKVEQTATTEFEEQRVRRLLGDEARTRRNRERRLKKKLKKANGTERPQKREEETR